MSDPEHLPKDPVPPSPMRIAPSFLTLAFTLAAAVSTGLAVYGAVLAYSPVPFWDMWNGYLGFYASLASEPASLWWSQHNEHRIVVARALFWLDIAAFQGRGVFLLVFNYAAVAAGCWLFLRSLRERWPLAPGWAYAFVAAWLALWIQSDNLTWGFQGQFMLAFVFPLCAFHLLHVAARRREVSHVPFAAAVAVGLLSVGTLASGVLALPLMTAFALMARMGRRRIVLLALLSTAAAAVYFADYVSPAHHGSLARALRETPLDVFRFMLLYLGGPFAVLFGGGAAAIEGGIAAGAAMIACCVMIAIQLLRNHPRDTSSLALLAFMAYVGGTAIGTAGGRSIFGLEQALSSRYMTPSLMAWAALFVLLAPAVDRLRGDARTTLAAGLAVLLWPMMTLQLEALKPRDDVLLERRLAALALELGVRDARQVATVFPNVDHALALAEAPRARNLSIFGLPPYRDARDRLHTRLVNPMEPDVKCAGFLDVAEQVDTSDGKPADPAYLRVRGWFFVFDRTPGTEALLVDEQGFVRGMVLLGQLRQDVAAVVASKAGHSGFRGYVDAEARHVGLSIADPVSGCRALIRWPGASAPSAER